MRGAPRDSDEVAAVCRRLAPWSAPSEWSVARRLEVLRDSIGMSYVVLSGVGVSRELGKEKIIVRLMTKGSLVL